MSMNDDEADIIPEEDFAEAIAACRQDPALNQLFTEAPKGARMILGLIFYASHFGDAVDGKKYEACLHQIEPDLEVTDIAYLLGKDIDESTKTYLTELLCEKQLGSRPSAKLKPVHRNAEPVQVASRGTPAADGVHNITEYDQMVAAAQEAGRKKRIRTALMTLAAGGIAIAAGIWGWQHFFAVRLDMPETGANPNVAHTAPEGKQTPKTAASQKSKDSFSSSVPTARSFDFESSKDKLVVFGNEGMQCGGSGFLLTMNGKRYLVTNEHVTRGPDDWFRDVVLLNGTHLELGAFEVADGQDLVRFEIKQEVPSFTVHQAVPKMNEEIAIYGNSAGGGAITELKGNVNAVGPYRLEVQIDAVAGNSGSPVLNAAGDVMGVFTYATNEQDGDDWGKQGTRFTGVRKWAVRLNDIRWKRIDWLKYREQCGKLNDAVRILKRIIPFFGLLSESFSRQAFKYSISYDEMSKMSSEREEIFLKEHLIEMSRKGQAYAKARQTYKDESSSAQDRETIELYDARIACLDTGKELCTEIEKALLDIQETLVRENWLAPHFRSDMTDFTPMKWYLDVISALINHQKRFLAALPKEIGAPTKKLTLFDRVKNRIAIIQAGNFVGTGFLLKMDDGIWMISNEHVVRGGRPFKATLSDGTALKFAPVIEVAEGRDLVRMKVLSKYPAFELIEDEPTENMHIHVFGNSDGGGVLTAPLHGNVQGVGGDRIEVSAQFVKGNSGSPIITDAGKVIGVATYAKIRYEPDAWIKMGTRFNGVRRFGYRIKGTIWKKIPWNDYAKLVKILEQSDCYIGLCEDLCFGGANGKKLMAEFEIGEIKGSKLLTDQVLLSALSNISRNDIELRATEKAYKETLEQAIRMKSTDIGYPDARLHNLHSRYPRMYHKSILARLDALKTGERYVNRDWKLTCLQKDAKENMLFFKFNIERYRTFNKEALLGPRSLPEPPPRHRR